MQAILRKDRDVVKRGITNHFAELSSSWDEWRRFAASSRFCAANGIERAYLSWTISAKPARSSISMRTVPSPNDWGKPKTVLSRAVGIQSHPKCETIFVSCQMGIKHYDSDHAGYDSSPNHCFPIASSLSVSRETMVCVLDVCHLWTPNQGDRYLNRGPRPRSSLLMLKLHSPADSLTNCFYL